MCTTALYTIYTADEYATRLMLDKPSTIKDNNYVNNLYTTKINGKNRTTLKVV